MIEYVMWCDVETTGLDPARDRLLEVCAVFAPLSYPTMDVANKLREPNGCFHHVFHCERSWSMSDVVRGMHERSGLLGECEVSTRYPADSDRELLDHFPEDQEQTRVYLAGSSPSLDRAFLREYMPLVAARLHYRLFDVAAMELLARALSAGRLPEIPRSEAHRARGDVRDAVDRFALVVRWLQVEDHHPRSWT